MTKTALVTGASRGIGRAVARELAREGYCLCVNYLTHRQEAESLADELRREGCRCLTVQADVADMAACRAMVQQAEAALGPVDLLVNNAGVSYAGLFQDLGDADWDRCLAVNLTGARNMVQAVLPYMLSEKAGAIVNISSIWGLRGASCEVAYACAKAGVVGLTRSLALELAPSHIRVNAVAPGCIETDMVRALDAETVRQLIDETPLGRLGQPEDVAHAVAFLASEKAGFITGQILTVDGGFIG
jgi:3-oxoacyl-[acyl-carrier protein] reductase